MRRTGGAHVLAAHEGTAYRRDGFFVREAVFAEKEIDSLRAAAERVAARAAREAAAVHDAGDRDYRIDRNRYLETDASTVQYEHGDVGTTTLRVIEPFHVLDAELSDLLGDRRIIAPVCGLLGTGAVSVWTDKLNLKRPYEGSAFRWHQDSPYWTHVCPHVDRLPNVMIALDDAHEGNGCFRVVRGSHRRGCLPGIHDDGTRLGPLFTDPAAFDEANQVPIEVPGGSLVFFDSHIVHGSRPNRSPLPRRAMVVTYQPPHHAMFKVDATRTESLG